MLLGWVYENPQAARNFGRKGKERKACGALMGLDPYGSYSFLRSMCVVVQTKRKSPRIPEDFWPFRPKARLAGDDEFGGVSNWLTKMTALLLEASNV